MSNFWDERFSGSEFFYGTAPNDFLRANTKYLPAKGKILCLGEGEGRNAVYLAKMGFDVTAIDQSKVGLEKLKKFATQENVTVHTLCSDLSDFEFVHESWHGIVSIWCHLPSSLRSKIYPQCVASLKPEGVMLIEAYTPEQLAFKSGGPKDPDLLSDRNDLESKLSGLKIILSQETKREIQEGKGHSGLSAVVQYVGFKAFSKTR